MIVADPEYMKHRYYLEGMKTHTPHRSIERISQNTVAATERRRLFDNRK